MASRFRKILVTTDFSDNANRALAPAAALAGRLGAELHLLHALVPGAEDGPPSSVAGTSGEAQRRSEDALRSLAAPLAELLQGSPVQVAVRRGLNAYDAILSHAHDLEASLIVISTHGRTGLGYVLLGSIAENVLRHAPCPVLVVQGRKTAAEEPPLVSLGRILVPCDLSEASQRAVAEAGPIAAAFGASVDLLHVVEAKTPAVLTTLGWGAVPGTDTASLEASAKLFMEQILRPLLPEDVAARLQVRSATHPAREIVTYAQEEGVGLILMTFRGYDDIGDYLLGSTTERTVRKAHCPVLVV